MSLTPSFEPDSPLFPPLASYMRVEFLANLEGGVWVLHDKPLPDILKWVDYDVDAGTVTLAMQTGKTQPLGLGVPKSMVDRLKKANEISVILVQEKKVQDFALVPLNIIGSSNF